MAKKENQRIALTRKLLQEGLIRLLQKKELEYISVTELCREAGINRATFYNHYSTPKELLTDIEQSMKDDFMALLTIPCSDDALTDQFEILCQYLKDHAAQYLILTKCHADDDLEASFKKLNQPFAGNTATGKCPDLDSYNMHLVSTFLYSGCYHLIREWIVRDIPKSSREIALLLRRIIHPSLQ